MWRDVYVLPKTSASFDFGQFINFILTTFAIHHPFIPGLGPTSFTNPLNINRWTLVPIGLLSLTHGLFSDLFSPVSFFSLILYFGFVAVPSAVKRALYT